ncbi:MAG TPA: DUF192 domain-containing protein [Patescibacteria group bacterium]|nr:DUF192 domain-containing protein [Patescibacteria group bacterium]
MVRRISIIILVFFAVSFGVFAYFQRETVLNWLAPAPQRAIVVLNQEEIYVEVAKTDFQRAKGLSSRPEMEANHGMLFLFDSPQYYSFWMKEMEFALDILWIRDGVVVDITRNIPVPGQDVSLSELKRYSADEPFDMVLELNAGYADAHNIEEGDAVNVILQSSQEAILI